MIKLARPERWPRRVFCQRDYVYPSGRRKFSSEEKTELVEAASAEEIAALIPRHGSSDGVITLSVGGTEFHTLRSTVNINPVLREHVRRAEANNEFIRSKAVFIDRDPSQFRLILQHLRNEADNLQASKGQLLKYKITKKKSTLIQFPKDQSHLQELFLEARYFQIDELQHAICAQSWYVNMASYIGAGSANPFQAFSDALKTARRTLLATSGVGIFVGTQNEDAVTWLKKLVNNVSGAKVFSLERESSGTNDSGAALA